MKCIKSILIIPAFDRQRERWAEREGQGHRQRNRERNEYGNVVSAKDIWTSAHRRKLPLSWMSHLSRENGVPR